MKHLVRKLLTLTWLALAAPVFAQESPKPVEPSKKQWRMLKALPSVEAVTAAIPRREDPLEDKLLRKNLLFQFGAMVDTLLPDRTPMEYRFQYPAPYRGAADEINREILVMLKVWRNNDPALRAEADRLQTEASARIYPDGQTFAAIQRNFFEQALDGELEDYALDWADAESRSATRKRPRNDFERFIHKLPEPWLGYYEKTMRMQGPLPVLLVVWIILGIAFRSVPFGLSSEDPWLLQRGTRRRRMGHRFSTVIDAREDLEIQTTTTRPVDEYGRAVGMGTVSTRTTRKMTIFVRDEHGQECTIKLTNIPIDLRPGHDLLEVYHEASGTYLFLYNYDLRTFTFMPAHKTFVKMRPLIVLPIWGLAAIAGNKYGSEFGEFITYGVPVAYLFFMWMVNFSRSSRFRGKLAPRLVEAAGTPPR